VRLSVQIEIDKAMDLETPKSTVLVGRSSNNDLVIPHDSVSRSHCCIDFQKGLFYITDLGSSNGTFIDGEKLSPNIRTKFPKNSQLTIGRLECDLGLSNSPVPHQERIISSTVSTSGDYTATMRISRIELNRPSLTLALEKNLKPKGPKNPISVPKVKEKPAKRSTNKWLMILVVLSAGVVTWILTD
jgi:pSer/pThr/pTyr-binding forkhead associated (FHA) protein